jgi:outer membrane protein OmpA-like peptidoglycan-associated protein
VITVAGIDAPAAISVVGGEYNINGGAFTATAGTVTVGQTVSVRQTSSASALTATTATVTIGGVAEGFTVTTGDPSDEVLVIDGGSSAVDPWSLAFLGGLPLLRRRRKVALKLATAVATVAAAVSLLAGPAGADETDRWDWDYDGLYLGLGVNGTSLETSDSFTSSLQDALGIQSSGNFEDFPVGGQAYAGWMFNRYWGLEGRYSATADGESDIYSRNVSTGVRTNLGKIEASLDGWTAYTVWNWPVVQRWDLFAKLGYTWQNAEVQVEAAGSSANASEDESDSGFAAGLGARWRFARHWAATVEGEYLDTDFDDVVDEPWRTSLNVEYWFGGHELPAPPPPPAKVVAAPPPPPPAPMDSDGDGVVDGTDQCPETPRGDRVGPAGCSCDVTRQLQFAFGSAELTDADKQILDEMAENLTRLKFVSGTIEGHTDSVGSEAFNQGLSERRAQTVAAYLESKGIAAGRMQVVGRGESDPVGDNNTAEGRAMNRRVVAKRTDCDK